MADANRRQSSYRRTRCRSTAGCRSSRTSPPARLVGDLAARPRGIGRRVRAARPRGDRRDPRRRADAGRRRRDGPLPARGARGARAAAAARAGRARALGGSSTTRIPSAAHARLAELDPAAAAAVHPNDRRRVVRALELAEAGASLAPDAGPALGGGDAASDADRRARRAEGRCSSAGSRSERARCSRPASRRRCARALAGPHLGDRAEDARPRRGRDAPARGGDRRRSSCARAGTPPTSASGCGASRASLWSMPIARRARSPMTSSRWHAHGNVYLVAESRRRTSMEPGSTASCRCSTIDGDDLHGRDRQPRRLARRDVGQRHAHRRGVADGPHRRRTSRACTSARCVVEVRRVGDGSTSRTWAQVEVGARGDGRRRRADAASTSATRTPSS